VAVPEYALGTEAVSLLAARLDDISSGREVWLSATLTVRGEDEGATVEFGGALPI
jgi:hypothetical protein